MYPLITALLLGAALSVTAEAAPPSTDSEEANAVVVVGAFVNEHMATAFAERHSRQLDMPLQIVAVEVKGQTYFRVSTPPVPDYLARQAIRYLKPSHPDAWIRRL